jgi:hypothetical protein
MGGPGALCQLKSGAEAPTAQALKVPIAVPERLGKAWKGLVQQYLERLKR